MNYFFFHFLCCRVGKCHHQHFTDGNLVTNNKLLNSLNKYCCFTRASSGGNQHIFVSKLYCFLLSFCPFHQKILYINLSFFSNTSSFSPFGRYFISFTAIAPSLIKSTP